MSATVPESDTLRRPALLSRTVRLLARANAATLSRSSWAAPKTLAASAWLRYFRSRGSFMASCSSGGGGGAFGFLRTYTVTVMRWLGSATPTTVAPFFAFLSEPGIGTMRDGFAMLGTPHLGCRCWFAVSQWVEEQRIPRRVS